LRLRLQIDPRSILGRLNLIAEVPRYIEVVAHGCCFGSISHSTSHVISFTLMMICRFTEPICSVMVDEETKDAEKNVSIGVIEKERNLQNP
jgi:hypothetical protein